MAVVPHPKQAFGHFPVANDPVGRRVRVESVEQDELFEPAFRS